MDPAGDKNIVTYSMTVQKDARPSKAPPSRHKPSRSGKEYTYSSNKPRNFSETSVSLSKNCCICCCVLAQYLRETGKLLASCMLDKPTNTRICELFWELLAASKSVSRDLLGLICEIFRILCIFDPKDN